MPEPSPADELRTAASSLRAATEPAPPCQHPGCGCCEGWHEEDRDGGTVCTGCDYDAHRYVSPGYPMPGGMGPLLADWLETVAAEMTSVDGTEYAYEEYPSWIAALAAARKINSKEQH